MVVANDPSRILIIDDEQVVLDSCSEILRETASAIATASDGRRGLEMVEERTQPGSTELRLSANLEPMALSLWTIDRQPRSAASQGNRQ